MLYIQYGQQCCAEAVTLVYATGTGPGIEHQSAGTGPMRPQEGYGPPEYPSLHPDPYQQPPQNGLQGYAAGMRSTFTLRNPLLS